MDNDYVMQTRFRSTMTIRMACVAILHFGTSLKTTVKLLWFCELCAHLRWGNEPIIAQAAAPLASAASDVLIFTLLQPIIVYSSTVAIAANYDTALLYYY